MTKSLGQVAYEAYALTEYADDTTLDKWPPSDVNGWQAAAEAVVKQHMMELTGADDYQWGTFELDADGAVISQDSGTTPRNILPGQRAVIEAAKAARWTLREILVVAPSACVPERITALLRAVEALQEVEGGL